MHIRHFIKGIAAAVRRQSETGTINPTHSLAATLSSRLCRLNVHVYTLMIAQRQQQQFNGHACPAMLSSTDDEKENKSDEEKKSSEEDTRKKRKITSS